MTEKRDKEFLGNGGRAPALWGWHTYLSIGITLIVLGILAAMVDLDRIWLEVAACDTKYVLLGMLAHYATYPARGLRWRRCLIHLPIKAGNAKFGLLVFFYNFVDNVVPAKLGDLYGAHLARINCGIRRSAALGSIVFLRMVDAWFVLIMAALASWFLFSERLPKAVAWALIGGSTIAVAATFVMVSVFLLKRSLPGWLPEKIREMIRAFRTGMWPRSSEIIFVFVLTVGIWSLEALWIFLLVLGFGVNLSAGVTVFLTMIPVLATAFPITPSGAGVVELTLFTCLRVVGISSPLAASLTVVNRFIDYWLHIGFGVLIWAIRDGVGLRTWREVPLRDFRGVHWLRSPVGQEDLS